MTSQRLDAIKQDFRRWSGGFSPESEYQVTVYLDYAAPQGVGDDPDIRCALLEWMANPDDPDESMVDWFRKLGQSSGRSNQQ